MTDSRPAEPPALRPAAPRGGGLEPERDTRGALSRLVEVLLDKGVYLDLDLIVTVAEVPLIAVDIRAAIAGVETMIEYGFVGPWASVSTRREPAPATPASDDIALRSAAWYREPRAGGAVWREGTVVIERSGALHWQGTGDRRASLRLTPQQLSGVRLRRAPAPIGDLVLELRSAAGIAELAGADVAGWPELLGGEHPGSEAEGSTA